MCALRSHPDANLNETILWQESITEKNIIRLKGPDATLDIQQRYDSTAGNGEGSLGWRIASNVPKRFTARKTTKRHEVRLYYLMLMLYNFNYWLD